jgi:hypothetical protein
LNFAPASIQAFCRAPLSSAWNLREKVHFELSRKLPALPSANRISNKLAARHILLTYGKEAIGSRRAEKTPERREALAEKDISPIPTIEDVTLLLDQNILPAFERIKEKIEPYYVKVRINRRKRTVGFYITEKNANYFCSVLVNREKRFIYFRSYYCFASGRSFSGRRTTQIQLLNKQIRFQSLEEITYDKIIELFNESFFSRIDGRENHLRNRKTRKIFNDVGEVKDP